MADLAVLLSFLLTVILLLFRRGLGHHVSSVAIKYGVLPANDREGPETSLKGENITYI